jgi:hypothetical protein
VFKESERHSVEELIQKYFTECDVNHKMQIVPAMVMNEALSKHLKGDKGMAFDYVIR